MAVAPHVLLNHVDQDPLQAGRATVGPGAPASRSRPPSASACATREWERAGFR
jgi:hypothetical protein